MQRVIAIVGRPNVGKSTLFNRLVGRRQALVHDQPGVTRDRLFGTCEWEQHRWWVVDTGGMLMGEDTLSTEVTQQSRRAIAEADVVICLFDGREGLTPLDEEVVAIVRRADVPVLFVVNKCELQSRVDDFYRLGVSPLHAISAEHSDGVAELCVALAQACPSPVMDMSDTPDGPLQVALIGRPNVGKSTLLNTLAGETRVVAHDMPGTTRDVIDVEVTRHGQRMIVLDTAGVRRKARTPTALEKYSLIKSLQAISRSDVVVLLMDATEGVTHQDRSLCAEATAQGRPVVVGLNKWDMVCAGRFASTGKARCSLKQGGPLRSPPCTPQTSIAQSVQSEKKLQQEYIEESRYRLGELSRLPMVCCSARTGDGLDQLWALIHRYGGAIRRKLTTSSLNKLLEKLQLEHHLPVYQGHNVKLFYMTQTGIKPPRFTTFTNFPRAIPVAYRRYMLKHLETALGAEGVPIALYFRNKSKRANSPKARKTAR